MSKRLAFILFLFLILAGCQQEQLTKDPAAKLAFSSDSVCFDTVFTTIGSSTKRIMVYNPNRNALLIDRVTLLGEYFQINLDGENRLENLQDIQINGGDSLFLFIQVNIDPQADNNPVLITDTVRFSVNGHVQALPLEAYGQNVTKICTPGRRTDYSFGWTFTNEKPYLVYDTLVMDGEIAIQPGTTFYMHSGSCMYLFGNLTAYGDKEHPIRILGDRTDKLFENVPYSHASGQWNGIYLVHSKDSPVPTYNIHHAEILSGNIGIYCTSEDKDSKGKLILESCRIHNHALYGIVLQNTDAAISNTEISNCASYCMYLEGGTHVLDHNTIASYFGWPYTNINIHNTSRDDVAAVYINNLSKETAITDVHIRNCIITGARDNNIVVATPLSEYYTGEIYGSYLKTDSIHEQWCHDNVYAQKDDTVFRNIYYRINDYNYYDFRPDSISPVLGIGDTAVAKLHPTDRLGNSRIHTKIDAGCYQYVKP